jgi:hypothetical protein
MEEIHASDTLNAILVDQLDDKSPGMNDDNCGMEVRYHAGHIQWSGSGNSFRNSPDRNLIVRLHKGINIATSCSGRYIITKSQLTHCR